MATALREIFANFIVDFDKNRSLQRGEGSVRRVTTGMRKSVKVADKLSKSFRALGVAIGGAAMGSSRKTRAMRPPESESTPRASRRSGSPRVTCSERMAL